MVAELGKVIIGQAAVIEQVMLTLFAGGNSLIVGVPGLAKTLLVRTVADVLDLKFARIQFTPDLMPSDITGTDIIQDDPETGKRHMVFSPGPVFTNVLLADEINRTPPKTQSALLEAMQEHRVTIQGRTYTLEEPFYVFATQNPIELEGTYPLPEAQLDRFMFHIVIEHPPEDEEFEVVRTTTAILEPNFERTVNGEDLIAFKRLVRRVPVADAEHALLALFAEGTGAAPGCLGHERIPVKLRDMCDARIALDHCGRVPSLPYGTKPHRLPELMTARIECHREILITTASSRPPTAG